jgi:methyltransferase (TIGR00027 family)
MSSSQTQSAQSRHDRRASSTALYAAMHRYVANREPDARFRGPDYLAELFLPARARFFLRFDFIHRRVRRKIPGVYEYVCARTMFFDGLFKEALADDIPQIVLLGAGYDTRALRFAGDIQSTRIIELDAPAIQAHKKKILQERGVELPPGLRFAPINFASQDLGHALAKAGYEKSQKTLFIWEGVIYYLPEDAVKSTLAFVRRESGPGSLVAFDYFYKSAIQGSSDYYGARQAVASAKRVGEPFLFGIAENGIRDFAERNGFQVWCHYTPEEMEQDYLRAGDGALYGKMFGFAGHACLRAGR